jgi:hypothetical protein
VPFPAVTACELGEAEMLKSGAGVEFGRLTLSKVTVQPVPFSFELTAMPTVALLDRVTLVEPNVVQLLPLEEV